uniref:hypothetical protein n=1 Tax=Pedobacter sp. TaxID=1411316 RepID=UPI00159AC4C2|nr:hypothetical protein [Pedobacter sp.]QJS06244.1 putative plasmid transfer protein [Pedobacter sp.]
MKKALFVFGCCFIVINTYGQKVIYDKGHMAIVNSNAGTRLAAELSYHASYEQIRKNTDDIGINLSSVVMAQSMIHRSLSEVNEGLKDAIQVKQLGYLINDIFKYSSEAMELAKGNPTLLLFAEDAARQMKVRGLGIVNDVSGFVLANNSEILINYNVRDELIRKVVAELQIINALIYTIKQNMYWARLRGIIKSANPYQDYIAQDLARLDEIIRKREMLKN